MDSWTPGESRIPFEIVFIVKIAALLERFSKLFSEIVQIETWSQTRFLVIKSYYWSNGFVYFPNCCFVIILEDIHDYMKQYGGFTGLTFP